MRFLLDGMLGKMTRWLRMMGHDASYDNDTADPSLIAIARTESRVLLTSDVELYRTAVARGVKSFLIKGRTEADRLANLASRFELDLRIDALNSRCPTCGSELLKVPRDEARPLVHQATFKTYRQFWQCANPACEKLYWQGSHWRKIHEVLKKARTLKAAK